MDAMNKGRDSTAQGHQKGKWPQASKKKIDGLAACLIHRRSVHHPVQSSQYLYSPVRDGNHAQSVVAID